MTINDWWSGSVVERFWMETTGRSDLGADLHAPQLNGAGKPEWGYSLVAETRPGDVVLHWHTSLVGQPALVGWSSVAGPLSVDEHYSWMPQGTRGRLRGVPTVGRGWRMPLGGFNRFERPISRADLAAHELELKAVAEAIRAEAMGAAYFPFNFYRPGEVRSSQSYLTKFPAALLEVLGIGELRSAVETEQLGRGEPVDDSGAGRRATDGLTSDPSGAVGAAAAVGARAGDRSSRQIRRSGVVEGLTVEHIDAALREWWSLGRDAFLAQYGGRPAERYVVAVDFGQVDALALVLGARSLAGMDTTGPWRGDLSNVADPLRALGFQVETADRRASPEIEAAELAVHDAAGRPGQTGGGGQGFMTDQKAKLAVEAHAMKLARTHYSRLGAVVDTASERSWDYEVDIAGDRWHVEVKGTTGDPVEVILTPNEVAHAKAYPFVALYVVSNIEVQTGPNDERITSGGTVTCFHPWTIDDGELRAVGYKYRLPHGGAAEEAARL